MNPKTRSTEQLMFKKATQEEQAAKKAAQIEQAAERQAAKEAERAAKEHEEFLRTPVGQARLAHERGDAVFQCSFDVENLDAIVRTMASLLPTGAYSRSKSSDPTTVLNAVCAEGWELVTGSFVFVHEGEVSRDKFLSSGQQVSTRGRTMGYYLFRRADAGNALKTAA
jgi:hypothetical protein